MFENVRRDLIRACRGNQGGVVGFFPLLRELFNPGTQAILVYRFGHWVDQMVPGIRHLGRCASLRPPVLFLLACRDFHPRQGENRTWLDDSHLGWRRVSAEYHDRS